MAQDDSHTNGNSAHPKKHFVIVGGSLGGLAAGLALRELGHDTTILERNPAMLLEHQGAGIVAGGDTLAFFKKYNRCDRPLAVTSHRRQYLDRSGNVIHEEDVDQSLMSWDLAYYLMRANYDGVESPYCQVPDRKPTDGKAVHLHDRNVTYIQERDDGGVEVFWQSSGGGEKGSILADVVVGADGPSSTVRTLMATTPEPPQRVYAGYCALRGTVPEGEASDAVRAAFCDRFTFYHGPGVQILAYLIPGPGGAVEPGRRLINFVYYANFPAGSAQLEELLTDRHGKRHRVTMPPGLTAAAAWEKQRWRARATLPPPFADLVCAARRPFVQAVTDVLSPDHEFLGGRVVLVGDALAGFRPHPAASTSQACLDAMLLADYVAGRVSRAHWRRETLGFARLIQRRGVDMGNRSQFGGNLPLEEHIRDRIAATVPREKEVYPDWATAI